MIPYPYTFSGRRASQSKYELEKLIEFLREKSVKRYLEIGARDGDTFYEIVKALGKDAQCVAIDLPGGLWGKALTSRNLDRAVKNLKEQGYDAHYALGDSTSSEIIDYVRSFGHFDAIFIDGDHTLDGVTNDWFNYGSMGDITIFHDIVGTGQSEKVSNRSVDVPILWEELKEYHEHLEIVDKDSKMGIGIIFNDKDII